MEDYVTEFRVLRQSCSDDTALCRGYNGGIKERYGADLVSAASTSIVDDNLNAVFVVAIVIVDIVVVCVVSGGWGSGFVILFRSTAIRDGST